jgi:hypothetical protein
MHQNEMLLSIISKLGRQTAHFSCNENFLLDFSFLVVRPKTKMPKLLFVIADNRKSFKKNALQKISKNYKR